MPFIPNTQIARSGTVSVVQLSTSPAAGATSFDLNAVPPDLKVGSIIAIDAYTTECELRSVSGIASLTVTVDVALKYAHASGDAVVIIEDATVPVELYALTGNGTDEWSPIQRLFREATFYGGLTIQGGSATYSIQQPLLVGSGWRTDRLNLQSRTGFAPVDMVGAFIVGANSTNDRTFTGTASSNLVTVSAGTVTSGDKIAFNAMYGETLPGGIVSGRVYFATSTGSAVTISATSGGATLDITSDGNGWAFWPVAGLHRVFLESLRVNLTVADLNGMWLSLQQPSWTRNLRIEMDANGTSTTVTGVNALDSATINVASTTGFPSSGSMAIEGATTKILATISYTGTTGTSFTGCGAHPATVGGELVTLNVRGLILTGQLSYHDNVEINTLAKCTGAEISGSGHVIRGFNCNGVADADTAIVIGGQFHTVYNPWLEALGRCAVEFSEDLGNQRGNLIVGSCFGTTSPNSQPWILAHGGSHSFIGTLRSTNTSQKLLFDTVTGVTLLGNDGATPLFGESDASNIYYGHHVYGGAAVLLGRRVLRPEANCTLNRVNDIVHVNTTSADITVTVPTAAFWRGWYTTIINAEGANNVIIDPAGAETIDGLSTFTLVPGEAVTIYSDHSNYRVLSHFVSTAVQTYAATNVTTDRAYDADTVVITELADVVGTLIADLRAKQIIA